MKNNKKLRRKDLFWFYRLLTWERVCKGTPRSIGRHTVRWEDGISNFAAARGFSWAKMAEDREAWEELEDGFLKFAFQSAAAKRGFALTHKRMVRCDE